MSEYDVLVIGAGPAGCCAALRMAALGYRVALAERSPFPRPRIGESLSPGVWNILHYLGVAETVTSAGFLRDLPVRVCWESREAPYRPAGDQASGLMVDRARFDALLLEAARQRGVKVFQPATVQRLQGEAGAWDLALRRGTESLELKTRLILDAGGRAAQRTPWRYDTGVATLALSTLAMGSGLPQETRIEALQDGWLWGSPHPSGGYRLMAFLDPQHLRERAVAGLAAGLRTRLAGSRWFAELAQADFAEAVRACHATAYLAGDAWRPGYLKLGEAAFAIDPLSSSGVEKAMRFTLQGVIAANTWLCNPDDGALAENFFLDRQVQAAATHAFWAKAYYAQAAIDQDRPFWRIRAGWSPQSGKDSGIAARFLTALAARESDGHRGADTAPQQAVLPMQSTALWAMRVELSPQLRFVQTPCVVDDRVQLRAAVSHPGQERPIAYLAGFDLADLLQNFPAPQNLAHLLAIWSQRMPTQDATRLAGWLLQQGWLRCEKPV